MKKILVVLISFVALTALGCGRGTKAGLGQFVGTWKTMYTILDSKGGRVSSGTLTVKQPSSDTVTFGESTSVVAGVGQFGVPNMQTQSASTLLNETKRIGKLRDQQRGVKTKLRTVSNDQ